MMSSWWIVALPTRVGAESLFWRLLEETSVHPGNLAALRTGTVQYGDSKAFPVVMTHGYLAKIIDPEFLASVAFLILDEAHQRTLPVSTIRALIKWCNRHTKVVIMGAGLNVASHISFFGAGVGGLDVVGRRYTIQRFQLPALQDEVTGHNIDSEVLVRVEMQARAEMEMSR